MMFKDEILMMDVLLLDDGILVRAKQDYDERFMEHEGQIPIYEGTDYSSIGIECVRENLGNVNITPELNEYIRKTYPEYFL